MLVTGPARQRYHIEEVTETLDNCVISQSSTVNNLGVTSAYYLRSIAKIRGEERLSW